MLYTDEEIVAAAMAAIARVNEEIERQLRAGELKSVNRSYKIYRTNDRARRNGAAIRAMVQRI